MPLIVLEGLDGAGKSTQLCLLGQRARREGHSVETMHFPRTDTPLYGETIARFLRGDFGSVEAVDPYMVAHLFAGDRALAAPTLRGWLGEGRWVFLDRYVYSNVAYQCAKMAGEEARGRLRDWILELEFGIYAIPRPDVSLFLDVPFEFTERRLTSQRGGGDREYLRGGSDVHEASLELQRGVREMFLEEVHRGSDLEVVDCGDANGGMCPPETIYGRIVAALDGAL